MVTIIWIIFILMLIVPVILYIIQDYNMSYYKLNGRRGIEIECWLKTRKWYNSFIYNIQREILDGYKINGEGVSIDDIEAVIDKKIKEFVTGENDTSTISNAFYWPDTPEGTKYWAKREHEFLAWYFGQYVDFHLTR